ncbi:DUF438 domain-containing protein [Lutispora thermophila]|uniref:PAC domain-containing protein n=1 Tax=Lutispora thermophila DSM 19022 TaxID=1122184 RepID=A0A1M6DQU5_9FIRM|nr:DUF438 domain-containing protein [Lutispora thermophila]SHI75634.1 hypothetical protein SAMN02745176_01241 [Lutispora thermophila DSM 19022]
MSEIINNREYRKKVLKELIMELHDGKSVEEVRERFAELIKGVSASEISEMEAALIAEGMPVQEVQRLCDVHAAVFKGSIEDIHKEDIQEIERTPGHPLHTFMLENREIEKLLNGKMSEAWEVFKADDSNSNIEKLVEAFNLLWEIDKHYSRKENLIFPYLEKYGITAPPKVMWGVDDEIRAEIKGIKIELEKYKGNKDEIIKRTETLMNKVIEMIFKEENILFPMCKDTLTEDEWLTIAEESGEIGFCLTEPAGVWKPKRVNLEKKEAIKASTEATGYVKLETGILKLEELEAMLNTLPFDITFVDKNDVVKYFSQGRERIFARTRAVIGRSVQNCHPPASVHVVEKIVQDFKAGAKDHEDFWIKMGDVYALIRYFAVRDGEGNYLGTLEVTQNIKPIQEIEGEKRLMS